MTIAELIPSLTSYIMTKSYVKINEIKSKFQISIEELYNYTDVIQDNLNDLGFIIEIIEVNNVDYILIYTQSNNKILNELQIALLTIFAIIGKSRNGTLKSDIKNKFDENYLDEMNYLEQINFIENNGDSWSISPLGALTIYPVIEKSKNIIENLFNFKLNKSTSL